MSEEKKKCPACAEEISAKATVCEFCGEKLSASSAPQTGQTAQELELYTPRAAANWSVLFTPIFGAYVMKNNWKILGCEQQKKRSKKWLIALSAILIISWLFLSEYCWGVYLLSLISWYVMECRAQIRYLTENKVNYQKKNWKSIALKAAGISVGVWIFLAVIGMLFGEPSLDCSSNQAFRESGEEIVKYLKDDIGGDELIEKAKYNDLSESEEKQMEKFGKVMMFFSIYNPSSIPDAVVKEIDGMSASELLDYIDENYELNRSGNWLSRSRR